MPEEITQKPISHYIQEEEVPEEFREKVIFAISHMVYERNHEIIDYNKSENQQLKDELRESIEETDEMIIKTIHNVIEGKEDAAIKCTDCFSF